MAQYSFVELVDLDQILAMMRQFHELTRINSKIVDLDGAVITTLGGEPVQAGWRRVCRDFHQAHPRAHALCRASDSASWRSANGKRLVPSTCLNGLSDLSIPILIDGEHLVNLITGQFFLTPPDRRFFQRRAGVLGYDVEDYLMAVDEVPVFDHDVVEQAAAFLETLARVIADLGLKQKRLLEQLDRSSAAAAAARLAEAEALVAMRRAEQAAAKLDFALEGAKSAFFELNLQPRAVNWSKGHGALFGHDPDLFPMPEIWQAMLHPEDVALWSDALARAIAERREEFCQDYRIVHPHKGVRWLTSRSRISYGGSGEAERVAGINIDITELVETRAALAASRDDALKARGVAEQASLAKSRFLAAASHDLRQPVHALNIYGEIVSGLLPDGNHPAALLLKQCVERLNAQLNALLDIARFDSDGFSVQRTRFDIGELVAETVGAMRPLADQRGLKLKAVPASHVVTTDRRLVERLLTNLLGNAVRYTEKGGVLVGLRRRKGAVCLEVWDTGIGIPHEQLGAIFEEFHQLNNPGRNSEGGTGLGLAIVRRIADMLGMTVSVRSVVGRGSVFSLALSG